MWRVFRPSKIVGLDLGAHEIKAVAISTKPKNIEIAGAARVNVTNSGEEPVSTALMAALGMLTAHDLFPAEWLVAGLNGNQVAVRSLILPRFKGRTGDALVRYEMESLLPYHADEIVVDYWVRPVENGNKTSILAMAAQKSVIVQLLDHLDHVAVEPRMLGWSTLGAYSALRQTHQAPAQGETRCLLDLGARSTSLVMFDSSGLQMVRSLDFGGEDMTEALAARVRLSPEQAEALKMEQGLLPQSPAEVKAPLIDVLSGLLQEIELSRLSLQTSLDQITITGATA
jgi:type IV pilus assembly protein PilM